jgi:hypothetical protein
MIGKGDIIVFKPRWRNAGDEKFSLVARDDEVMGVVDYSALELADWPIWLVHTASADMVEAIVGHLNEEDGTKHGRRNMRPS